MTSLYFHVVAREYAWKLYDWFGDCDSFIHRIITPNAYRIHLRIEGKFPGKIERAVDRLYCKLTGCAEHRLFVSLVNLGR